MRNLLFVVSIVSASLFVLLSFSNITYAQCTIVGATPGGGQEVVCTGSGTNGLTTTELPDQVTVEPGADISRAGTSTISTEGDNDLIIINGGRIDCLTGCDAVFAGEGEDEIRMSGGYLTSAGQDCIDGGPQNDLILVSGGLLECDDDVVEGDDGDDTIIVTGGVLRSTVDDDGIAGVDGNDTIFVSNALVIKSPEDNDHSINGGLDNDTVSLGNGARLIGGITGAEGFDTLVFEMSVRESEIPGLCAQIDSSSPQAGSIIINGLLYEWEDFEVLICDLTPGQPPVLIPTLSQWGLIAMAGVLCLAGLFVMRRRAAV